MAFKIAKKKEKICMRKTQTLTLVIVLLSIVCIGLLVVYYLQEAELKQYEAMSQGLKLEAKDKSPGDIEEPVQKALEDSSSKDSRLEQIGTASDTAKSMSKSPMPASKAEDSFTIGMVGDILIHDSLINGTRQEDGSYNFRPIFKYVEPQIKNLDLAIFDMEGTFRGEPYAGYPAFSTPEDLAADLKEVGFNLAITANNHAIDFGIPAMQRTIKVLRDAGIENIGTRLSPEEPTFMIKEMGGIKAGISAWTYESARMGENFELRALNNIPFSAEDAKLIDSFYAMGGATDLMEVDAQRIRDRIKEMRKAGAETIIFIMHWGTEYMPEHDASQAFYAQVLANEGVDLVLACGPHVAQPIREVVSEDGNHHMLCYYSVGNCVSNQQFDTGNSQGHAQDGLMAVVKFARKPGGEVGISRAGYMTHTAYKQYPHGRDAEFTEALYLPLEAALSNPAAFNLSEDGINEAKLAKERIDSVMSKNKELDFKLEKLTTAAFD